MRMDTQKGMRTDRHDEVSIRFFAILGTRLKINALREARL
jgi:hypothetical protein